MEAIAVPLDRTHGPCVLVLFEQTANGRVALEYAVAQADENLAELTVVSAMPYERVDVGCASCRHGAAIWNREMRYDADRTLAEAREHLTGRENVTYAITKGQAARSIAQAAERLQADIVILPWRPPHRLRRIGFSSLAERLTALGAWQVTVAPAVTGGPVECAPSTTRPEWGRLRLAAAFFMVCAALVVALTAIGFYH